jgi:hypothetical protein
MRGSVVVSCYSRPEAFEKLVASIYSNYGVNELKKIFLVQDSREDLNTIIETYQDKETLIINAPAFADSPLANINFNRFHSQVIAFDILRSDWSLIIEEDVELNTNVIFFVQEIMKSFMSDKYFRGINLGSYELEGDLGDYSIVNQGIHGQASAIPRRTWSEIKKKVSHANLYKDAYDWIVEPIFRNGFVVVPNRSLFLDHGWVFPTHAPSDSSAPHYLKLESSYRQSNSRLMKSKISQKQITHTWFGTQTYRDSPFFLLLIRVKNLWIYSQMRKSLHRVYASKIRVWHSR